MTWLGEAVFGAFVGKGVSFLLGVPVGLCVGDEVLHAPIYIYNLVKNIHVCIPHQSTPTNRHTNNPDNPVNIFITRFLSVLHYSFLSHFLVVVVCSVGDRYVM